jgi:hypothetical protein
MLICTAREVYAQDRVTIKGTTSCYIDYKDTEKLRSDDAYYEPLPEVEVSVEPKPTNVSHPGSIKSQPSKDDQGRDVAGFGFTFPNGPPIHVLYSHRTSDKNYVPILKSLSGEAGRVQEIHTTLLTRDQYIARYGYDLLKLEMQHLYQKLKKLGSDENTLKSMREYIRSKFDVNVE